MGAHHYVRKMKMNRIFKMLVPDNLNVKQLQKMLALWVAFIVVIGIPGLKEFNKYNQFTDHRDQITLYGNDAKTTLYGVLAVCSIMTVYSLLLLLLAVYRNKRNKSNADK